MCNYHNNSWNRKKKEIGDYMKLKVLKEYKDKELNRYVSPNESPITVSEKRGFELLNAKYKGETVVEVWAEETSEEKEIEPTKDKRVNKRKQTDKVLSE